MFDTEVHGKQSAFASEKIVVTWPTVCKVCNGHPYSLDGFLIPMHAPSRFLSLALQPRRRCGHYFHLRCWSILGRSFRRNPGWHPLSKTDENGI
jgi:hypothetical protein